MTANGRGKGSHFVPVNLIFAESQKFCMVCHRHQPFPRRLIRRARRLSCPILIQLNIQLKFIVSESNVVCRTQAIVRGRELGLLTD